MKRKPPEDPLKASRKGSREAEIGMFGHPVARHRVHKSQKQYDRKTAKARLKKASLGFCRMGNRRTHAEKKLTGCGYGNFYLFLNDRISTALSSYS
jgi:hypothetical protein